LYLIRCTEHSINFEWDYVSVNVNQKFLTLLE